MCEGRFVILLSDKDMLLPGSLADGGGDPRSECRTWSAIARPDLSPEGSFQTFIQRLLRTTR